MTFSLTYFLVLKPGGAGKYSFGSSLTFRFSWEVSHIFPWFSYDFPMKRPVYGLRPRSQEEPAFNWAALDREGFDGQFMEKITMFPWKIKDFYGH